MAIRSVKVSNLSLRTAEEDVKEFFSFSGEVESIEIHGDKERFAYVTFKDSQGAETAVLLSGASVADQFIIIELASDYNPPEAPSAPHAAAQSSSSRTQGEENNVVLKAEDVVSSMLAKGFILGKGALGKAKSFDERHGLTSTAAAKAASLDQRIGLSQKLTAGTTMVNEKVKEMDQKFQVIGKTKFAFAAAEQTVSSAGSAMMRNRYVLRGATWVMGAFNRVAKVAGDVGQKTREKIQTEAQPEKPPEGYSPIHSSESSIHTL